METFKILYIRRIYNNLYHKIRAELLTNREKPKSQNRKTIFCWNQGRMKSINQYKSNEKEELLLKPKDLQFETSQQDSCNI